jgi:hypothetical protein
MFRIVIILIFSCINFDNIYAGPPFLTDDPEPVELKHWEFYIASTSLFEPDNFSGTLPHFETNFGILTNVQIHLLIPFNYIVKSHQKIHYGYSNTEFGVKWRFIRENKNNPQIGIFPVIEIPTFRNFEISDNKTQLFLPVWIQKSWNKFTTYGGGGYWINPGINNKNWFFAGWLWQYDFSDMITLGSEIFYHTAESIDDKSCVGFNVGGNLNFNKKFHFIYSFGYNKSLKGNSLMSYGGFLWTI